MAMRLRQAAPMGGGNSAATRRIQRELKEISESPSRHWTASPAGDDLFEWQFAIRGPPDTDFEGGIYTGRLVLPVNYPMAPPSITLLTPNGRWEINKKICLSNTSYHPEMWQPAWGIRTMMEALRSHFPMPGEGAIAAIDWPSDLRKQLAKESLDFVCVSGRPNRELLPELSPEELKEEDGGVVVPPELQAPAISASAAEALRAAEGGAVQEGDAATFQPAAAAPEAVAPEGLRHRNNASNAVGPLPSETESVAPGTVAPVPSLAAEGPRQNAYVPPVVAEAAAAAAVSTVTAGATAEEGRPSRRRREGQQGQRRPQRPVLVQLFKPPESRQGWILLSINVLIALLMISFLVTLADIAVNPPQLFDALLDKKEE